MYKIYGTGVVWCPSSNKPLFKFKDGVYLTGDEKLATLLKKRGYKVEGELRKK